MKFWELISVAGDTSLAGMIAAENAQWSDFASWCVEFDVLVSGQDRDKLDHELPDEFCRAVLAQLPQSYYLSANQLRPFRRSSADIELNAVEAFDRFGGHAIEDALEKGSWPIGGLQ